MRAPFKAYVTMNFDPLLSEAASAAGFASVHSYPALFPPDIERCKKPLFYMHGHASPEGTPRGDNLVFCRSEFEQAYGDIGAVRNFVVNLLMNYPIVFIGCNLSEPEIHQQFQRVRQMLSQMNTTGAPPPSRFVLAETIISATTGDRDDGAEEAQVHRCGTECFLSAAISFVHWLRVNRSVSESHVSRTIRVGDKRWRPRR